MSLERDLLGDLVLSRIWWGLGNHRGGMKSQVFLNEDDALLEFARIERRRVRHGYQKVARRFVAPAPLPRHTSYQAAQAA
ncbi:MAG: hypothetical protein M0T84_12175 [Betaproteobacteria bacterium]|nr:hypothetical protein [Betaproteobacteria bacterium]